MAKSTTKVFKVTSALLLLALIFVAFFYPALTSEHPVSNIKHEMTSLLLAMQQFRTTYGAYPKGSNAEISRQLFGENPQRIVYFETSERLINASGELTDPWGTPIRINTSEDQIEIRSAGPNKIFGDADDQTVKN